MERAREQDTFAPEGSLNSRQHLKKKKNLSLLLLLLAVTAQAHQPRLTDFRSSKKRYGQTGHENSRNRRQNASKHTSHTSRSICLTLFSNNLTKFVERRINITLLYVRENDTSLLPASWFDCPVFGTAVVAREHHGGSVNASSCTEPCCGC